MNIVLRKLIMGAGLIFMLATGVGGVFATPTPVHAADNFCIDDDGQIRPDSLAPCLDPTPENGNKPQDYAWITDMWNWSLSLVNIFAALVLITMAFANILYPWQALEQFRIRQLLPTFIWGVILANASLFICRAVVTLADLLMSDAGLQVDPAKLFINWGFDPGLLSLGTMAAMFGTQTPTGIGDLFYQFIFSIVFIFIPIIGMIILSFIFYFRTALIFILTALSPLAFASIIFPPTRNFLGKWWDWFWKWTFGGVASWVILFIASLITVSEETKNQGGFTTDLLPYFLTFAFVYMAIMAPFKLGGAIGSMVERLGRKGVGMGVGLTKFAGGKGYHYASLGATRGIGTAEGKLSKLKESGTATAAQISAAERSVRNRKALRDLIRSPSIVKDTLDTVQASEQKAIKKGELGSGLRTGLIEQMLPGDEAAKAYLGAAGEAQKDWTPADLSATLKGTDWYQKGVAAGWIDGDFRDKMMSGKKYDELIEKAGKYGQKISKKDLADTGSALKYAQRYRNIYRHGAKDPRQELVDMGAYAPAGGAVGARNAGITQFGAGVTRESHLEDAVSHLQGLTQINDSRVIRDAIQVASENGSLNQARFQTQLGLNSLSPEAGENIAKVLSEYQGKVGRLSSMPVDVNRSLEETTKWSVNRTDNSKDLVQELKDKETESLKHLETLAQKDGTETIDAGTRETILKSHPELTIDSGATTDEVRHKLQESVVGARSLAEQLKLAEAQMTKKLQSDLQSNPEKVKLNATAVYQVATKGSTDLGQITQGLQGAKNEVAKALLASKGSDISVTKKTIVKYRPDLETTLTSDEAIRAAAEDLATGMAEVGQTVKEAFESTSGSGAGSQVVRKVTAKFSPANQTSTSSAGSAQSAPTTARPTTSTPNSTRYQSNIGSKLNKFEDISNVDIANAGPADLEDIRQIKANLKDKLDNARTNNDTDRVAKINTVLDRVSGIENMIRNSAR